MTTSEIIGFIMGLLFGGACGYECGLSEMRSRLRLFMRAGNDSINQFMADAVEREKQEGVEG